MAKAGYAMTMMTTTCDCVLVC